MPATGSCLKQESAGLCPAQLYHNASYSFSHEPGRCFSGSIMTEIIFGYPGVGTLIQKAILQSDYNMILGCITISIVAISTATLIVD